MEEPCDSAPPLSLIKRHKIKERTRREKIGGERKSGAGPEPVEMLSDTDSGPAPQKSNQSQLKHDRHFNRMRKVTYYLAKHLSFRFSQTDPFARECVRFQKPSRFFTKCSIIIIIRIS